MCNLACNGTVPTPSPLLSNPACIRRSDLAPSLYQWNGPRSVSTPGIAIARFTQNTEVMAQPNYPHHLYLRFKFFSFKQTPTQMNSHTIVHSASSLIYTHRTRQSAIKTRPTVRPRLHSTDRRLGTGPRSPPSSHQQTPFSVRDDRARRGPQCQTVSTACL